MPKYPSSDTPTSYIRPEFGSEQIRSLDQLKMGHILRRITRTQDITILVLSNPHPDSKGAWKFKCIGWPTLIGNVETLYCSDCGVIAYDGGRWSITNCLLATEHKPLEAEEFRKVLEKLDL